MGDVYDLMRKLKPRLRTGDLESCAQEAAKRLAALPKTPFHIALSLKITNPPAKVAAHFDEFFAKEAARGPLRAAYTEINGFDINTDEWRFDTLAYREYGGLDDLDWLSKPSSERFPSMTITGFEKLQEAYAKLLDGDNDEDEDDAEEEDADEDDEGDEDEDDELLRFEEASGYAGLLFVVRFQELIQRSAPLMKNLQFPLLATAHDYTFIYEARPGASAKSAGGSAPPGGMPGLPKKGGKPKQ